MRHPSPFRSNLTYARVRSRGAARGWAMMLSLAIAGCTAGPAGSSSPGGPAPSSASTSSASSPDDAAGNGATTADASGSVTAEIAARRAREMAEAMSRGEVTGEPAGGRSPRSFGNEPPGGAPEVRWTDAPRVAVANADSLRTSTATPSANSANVEGAAIPTAVTRQPVSPSDPPQATPSSPGSQPDSRAASETSPPDRDELVRLLLARVQQSDDPVLRKAAATAVLSLVAPDAELDPASLTDLSLRERERVLRFHEAVRALHTAVVEDRQSLDERRVLAALREVFGPQPIEITKLELCKSVRGFGVYEPFEQQAFLAGQSQKMIVYLELENFVSRELGPEKREVRLTQEVVLYNATDGLAVWRQRPVEVVDQSRNARRDFFVVQMIELPANLGVGKYVLKVKVRDLHGETMHEAARPIELVADRELTQERRGE